jgi:hypothetical protein
MLQITLHLTRSSRLWTLLLLGLELCISTRHFNRFYGDTHRRDFIIYVYHTIFYKISLAEVKEYYKKLYPFGQHTYHSYHRDAIGDSSEIIIM